MITGDLKLMINSLRRNMSHMDEQERLDIEILIAIVQNVEGTIDTLKNADLCGLDKVPTGLIIRFLTEDIQEAFDETY